jgi:PhzF family phenazine biosynthesis protein
MSVPIYQVDAFTDQPFHGNPAAVCPLPYWFDDSLLQAIAAENNLSETAFIVARDSAFELRWFTPTTEVDLCGHATLAAAFVVFNRLNYQLPEVRFHTRASGILTVKYGAGGMLTMDFPLRRARVCPPPTALIEGLGLQPQEVLFADDYLVILASEQEVRAVRPRFDLLATLPGRGVIISAAGERTDIVSRFFAPKYGINEDPVTGSAHCTLTPYWCDRLDTTRLVAQQISARTGNIICELRKERVLLSGHAVLILEGVLHYGQHPAQN